MMSNAHCITLSQLVPPYPPPPPLPSCPPPPPPPPPSSPPPPTASTSTDSPRSPDGVMGQVNLKFIPKKWINIALDLAGPYPTTQQGNRYIVIITDAVLPLIIAFPICDVSLPSVAVVIQNMFAQRGFPRTIITEDTPQWRDPSWQTQCLAWGSEPWLVSADEAYIQVASNRFQKLKQELHQRLAGAQDLVAQWDTFIPDILLMVRMWMIIQREPVVQITNCVERPDMMSRTNIENLYSMNEPVVMGMHRLAAQHERRGVLDRYAPASEIPQQSPLKEGSWIDVRNLTANCRGLVAGLTAKWVGPFKVLKVHGSDVFTIGRMSTSSTSSNITIPVDGTADEVKAAAIQIIQQENRRVKRQIKRLKKSTSGCYSVTKGSLSSVQSTGIAATLVQEEETAPSSNQSMKKSGSPMQSSERAASPTMIMEESTSPMQLTEISTCSTKPIKTVNSLQSMDRYGSPMNSSERAANPTVSMDKPVSPLQLTETSVNLTQLRERCASPLQSVERSGSPIQSTERPASSTQSAEPMEESHEDVKPTLIKHEQNNSTCADTLSAELGHDNISATLTQSTKPVEENHEDVKPPMIKCEEDSHMYAETSYAELINGDVEYLQAVKSESLSDGEDISSPQSMWPDEWARSNLEDELLQFMEQDDQDATACASMPLKQEEDQPDEWDKVDAAQSMKMSVHD